jgi:hypothetical protein
VCSGEVYHACILISYINLTFLIVFWLSDLLLYFTVVVFFHFETNPVSFLVIQWAGVKPVVLWYVEKKKGEEFLVRIWNMYIGSSIAIAKI